MLAAGGFGCQAPEPSGSEADQAMADPAMQLHHMHGLMAHGFEMALEGTNLVMLGQMEMTELVDEAARTHGTAMIAEGRALITDVMSGEAMTALHEATGADPAAMSYTHELGSAMNTVVDIIETMEAEMIAGADHMALHHLHLLLSHAGQMAAQGATTAMAGTMDMAGSVDAEARRHGAAMIDHARSLHETAMSGETMQALHAANVPEGMTETHQLGDAVGAVIELLARMP